MPTIVASAADSVPGRCAGQPSWQQALKRAVRDPVELCRLLGLDRHYEKEALAAAREFPLFVPWAYLRKIRPGDAGDPLLRQVLPLADELSAASGYTADPLAEEHATLRPGVIQKYAGRVLIVTTGVCAVHCR